LCDALRATPFGPDFEATLTSRRREADEFYATVIPSTLSDDARHVMRQAFAGLLWSKQFYHYDVRTRLARGGGRGRRPPAGLPRPSVETTIPTATRAPRGSGARGPVPARRRSGGAGAIATGATSTTR